MKKTLNRIAVATFFAVLVIAPAAFLAKHQATADGMPGTKHPSGIVTADGIPGTKIPPNGNVSTIADGVPGTKIPGGGGVSPTTIADGMPGTKHPVVNV